MKSLNTIAIILLAISLSSCGSDSDESLQPDNKYPIELVGTWQFYSGNPVALLSNIDENNILNQSFIFVNNGNLSETIVHYNGNGQDKTSSVNGNWYVENKQLKLTDWQGNLIVGNYSHKINTDGSLKLTIGGKSAIYYKQEQIKKIYPSLIAGTWNSLRQDGGRTRMIFNSNGKGAFLSTYFEGAFYGRADFSWSYSDNVITVVYENRPSSLATEEYVINYLNNKSISWTFKNNTVYYLREN